MNICSFCGLRTDTREHHIVPRSKGGTVTVPTCMTCEGFIHSNWSHNQLRDEYNTVESILSTEKFQKFLKWRLKQYNSIIFKSNRNKTRDKRKYS